MPGAGFITPAGEPTPSEAQDRAEFARDLSAVEDISPGADPGKVKGLLARMDRNVDRQAARRAGKGKS